MFTIIFPVPLNEDRFHTIVLFNEGLQIFTFRNVNLGRLGAVYFLLFLFDGSSAAGFAVCDRNFVSNRVLFLDLSWERSPRNTRAPPGSCLLCSLPLLLYLFQLHYSQLAFLLIRWSIEEHLVLFHRSTTNIFEERPWHPLPHRRHRVRPLPHRTHRIS